MLDMSYSVISLGMVVFILIMPILRFGFGKHLFNHSNGDSSSAQANGLEESDSDYLVTRSPYFLCLKDGRGKWLSVSRRYQDFMGVLDASVLGQTDLELSLNPHCDSEMLRLSALRDQEAWEFGQAVSNVTELKSVTGADPGASISVEITRTPIFDGNGKRYRMLITGYPVELKSANGEEIYTAWFYSCQLPFMFLDAEFVTLGVNNAFTELTGYAKRDALGKRFVFLESLGGSEQFSRVVSAYMRQPNSLEWSTEMACVCKDGSNVPIRLMISKIVTEKEGYAQQHYIAYILDIRKQKESEDKLSKIPYYDNLTGLPNRTHFIGQFNKVLLTSNRNKQHASVFFINLDRFKAVNDSLGHDVGDLLLKEVAGRLGEVFKGNDFIARVGADEFAILHLTDDSYDQLVVVSSVISRSILTELSKPFHLSTYETYLSVSVGISISPEDGQEADLLLRNAEIAMQAAKREGSNKVQFFDQKYTSKARERHELEANLRRSIQRRELQLFYQPQYDANTLEICGAEVLIRWFFGQGKPIPPYYFIDVAEETGFIITMGNWILHTACAQLQEWVNRSYPLQRLSVNVSVRQFMDPHFVEVVESALQNSGLNPKYLELEITESMLVGDTKRIELQLKRFKSMGIKIALDDFGTGYSSLAYLKNFPIDIVKIDQSFVRGMSPGSTDSKIVCAIIEMGHSLEYKVVAEGVENIEQFEFLRDKGCDMIQGYYFNKPMPLTDMTSLLAGLSERERKPFSHV